MDTSSMNHHIQNGNGIPKRTSSPSSSPRPPAYTPHRQSSSRGNLSLLQQQQVRDSIIMGRPALIAAVLQDAAADSNCRYDNDDDVDSAAEGISPISLRINTSVLVSKDNNLVCLTDTPASHANAIARAVVQAVQESSSGQCGIPMVDEDGRPRPVKIEVDASITVEGSGNVVGNEAIINQVLGRHGLARKRGATTASAAADDDDDDDDDGDGDGNGDDGDDLAGHDSSLPGEARMKRQCVSRCGSSSSSNSNSNSNNNP